MLIATNQYGVLAACGVLKARTPGGTAIDGTPTLVLIYSNPGEWQIEVPVKEAERLKRLGFQVKELPAPAAE